MTGEPHSDLRIVRASSPARPGSDMELSRRMLSAAAHQPKGPVLRMYSPGPTAAFGRLDELRSGFGQAVDAALKCGFTPVVRLAGGHAVVYDPDSLVLELILSETRAHDRSEGRFELMSRLITLGLDRIGISVESGQLPNEYCPGRFSLHLPRGPKIAGVAQRLKQGASLTTAVLAVHSSPTVRALTGEIYRHLNLPLDPATIGAIGDAHRAVRSEDVVAAIASVARHVDVAQSSPGSSRVQPREARSRAYPAKRTLL